MTWSQPVCKAMSFESKIKHLEETVSAGIHEVYTGLNRPDYGVPPKLGGDSPEQINWLVILVMIAVCVSIGLGIYFDNKCRGTMMEGRPRFWSILLLLASYLLLIPGLINPVFSFSIVINIIGHRKVVEPETGHPVCTETTNGLAHLLWKTGSKIGAFLVILFSMVIPAIELVMLILGEVFRFGSAKCAEIFRWVIIWVQHRSKWASPDMFAYILLVDLVRTLEVESLILSRARLEIGFSCFSTFVVTATVSSLGIPFPQVQLAEERPTAPILLRLFGRKGIAAIAALSTMLFLPVFLKGLYSPCMSFHIETKQLFPPYGPLPEAAKPAIDILDLKDLLKSETSIASCIQDYIARLPEWEANTFISLALMVFCVVGFTLVDMIFLMFAAIELAFGSAFQNPLATLNANLRGYLGHSWIDMARILRKLSMLDVAMVGVYLVTVCMSMYAKYGVVVSLEHGMMILLASEIVHSITYYIVESAWNHQEIEEELKEVEVDKLTDGMDGTPQNSWSAITGCCSNRWTLSPGPASAFPMGLLS